MKKIIIHILSAMMIFAGVQGLAGETPAPPSGEKILIVYYSRSGNTRQIADYIQSATGGKSVELVTVTPYPADYRTLTEQAKKEINDGIKPGLKSKPDSIKEYDVIFVGSPCWWSTMAPPVATFLSSHDFSGKTIIPFMTHEGSGLGHYVDDIKKMCPKGNVTGAKAFRGNSAKNAQQDVSDWLRQINMIK